MRLKFSLRQLFYPSGSGFDHLKIVKQKLATEMAVY